jgi:hypothetical protein
MRFLILKREYIEYIYLCLIIVGIFLKFYLISGLGLPFTIPYIFVSVGVFLFLGNLFFIKERKLHAQSLLIALIISALLVLSSFVWISWYNAYSYVGIFIFLVIYESDWKKVFFFLKILLILNCIISGFEYFNREYLFDTIIDNSMLSTEINSYQMNLYSIFRAKGLYAGPLTLAQTSALMAIIFRKNYFLVLIALLSSYFAGTRTGMGVSFSMLIIGVWENGKSFYPIFYIPLIVICVFSILLIWGADSQIERLAESFDFEESSSNLARIYFWTNGINLLLSYDIIHLLFGNNGLFMHKYQNNPESGWLSLFLDNGILGFIFYFYFFVKISISSIFKNKYPILIITLILGGVNLVVTYHLSAPGNLLYWIVIFSLLRDVKVSKGGFYSKAI